MRERWALELVVTHSADPFTDLGLCIGVLDCDRLACTFFISALADSFSPISSPSPQEQKIEDIYPTA
jgi:hypothetical protein